ncbi:LysR family transcriptional regulator [Sinisalibacter lacisalsi]|nr:LysR family transcriptional regulator [Sinisalibacter lacisalsi]
MKVSLRQLEILQAIAVAGSISRATRRLGMSQPSISQQLAKMEEVLGAQLFVRGRNPRTELTPAGEFWADAASRILTSVDAAETLHQDLFDERGLNLSFGTTPSLTGRFTELVARIAVSIRPFSRFDLVWAINSYELIELLMTHRINVAVLSSESVAAHRSSLNLLPLYEDKIVWAVPDSIPEEMIRDCLAEGSAPNQCESLQRYADLDGIAPWFGKTRNWYRGVLPFAQPYFGCMTHESAVQIVAAGLATCHTPISLIPNLSASVRERVRFYEVEESAREVMLAMPKHLASVRPFSDFAEQLATSVRKEYSSPDLEIRPLPLPDGARAGL